MRSFEEKGGKNGATIAEALKEAGERLRAAFVPNDLLDAQTLLAEALGKDRTYLIINFNQQLSAFCRRSGRWSIGAPRERAAAIYHRPPGIFRPRLRGHARRPDPAT